MRCWPTDALLFTEMINSTSLELSHGHKKSTNLTQEICPIRAKISEQLSKKY